MACFRYIIVNTLHKGDNRYEDDDYNNNNNIWKKQHQGTAKKEKQPYWALHTYFGTL
jgi:hypothetical protein